MREKSFSKILYKFLYETEIVTFQRILMIGGIFSSEGGKKDRTKYNGLLIQIESKFKFKTHVMNPFG